MRNKGFTLIETVITLVVLGVLSVVGVVSYTAITSSVSDGNARTLLTSLTPGQDAHYSVFGSFTTDPAELARLYPDLDASVFTGSDTPATEGTISLLATSDPATGVKQLVMVTLSRTGTCMFRIHTPPGSPATGTTGEAAGACTADNVAQVNSFDVAPPVPDTVTAPARFRVVPEVERNILYWDDNEQLVYTVTVECLSEAGCSPRTVTATEPGVFIDTLLNPGVTYGYTITASNGTDPVSVGPLWATPLPAPVDPVTPDSDPEAPVVVSNVAATAGDLSAVLSWAAPVNAPEPLTGFTTRYRTSPDGPWNRIPGLLPVGSTSTSITGLNADQAYDFSVRAHNAFATGPWSAPVTATTNTAP